MALNPHYTYMADEPIIGTLALVGAIKLAFSSQVIVPTTKQL